MSDDAVQSRRPWPWLKIALIASLALNLAIGAAVATRFARGPAAERMPGASYVQLVPRKFLSGLPRERRREIVEVLNRYRKELRGEREEARALTLRLADAIAAEPYSQEAITAAVQAFSGQGAKLSQRGGDAALEILGMLSPDERKQLADAVRERSSKRR